MRVPFSGHRRAVRHIFLVGQDTAGYIGKLKRGFTDAGFDSTVLAFPNHFGYGEQVKQKSISQFLRSIFSYLGNLRIFRGLFIICTSFLLFLLASGSSVVILVSPTVPYLLVARVARAKSARVISVFHGSDIRLPFLDGTQIIHHSPAALARATLQRKKFASEVEKLSDAVVAWSTLGHLLEADFFTMEQVGFPLEERPAKGEDSKTCLALELEGDSKRSVVRILHSPSNRDAKGTRSILDAIANLKAEGVQIELELLENSPNRAVQKALQNADILVDQLYADSFPSVLALEAISAGVSVVSCGWSLDEQLINFWRPKGLTIGRPEDFLSLLRDAIEEHSQPRRTKANSDRELFLESWSSAEVAVRLIEIAMGISPSAWWDSPEGLFGPLPEYALGGYGEEEEVRLAAKETLTALQGRSSAIANLEYVTAWAQESD
jgi:hypothetical protein